MAYLDAPSAAALGQWAAQNLSLLAPVQAAQDVASEATLRGAAQEAAVQEQQAREAQAMQVREAQAQAAQAQAAQEQAAEAQAMQARAMREPLASGLLGAAPARPDALQGLVTLRYQQGLLGYKDAYQRAEQAGDAQGMKDAADGAAVLRREAQGAGIDLSGAYAGADNTRGELAAAITAANIGAFQSSMGAMDSAAFYDKSYKAARQAGAGARAADRYAAEQAAAYQARRLADLRMELLARGVTNDGAINNYGTALVDMIRDEDPDSAVIPTAF